MHSFYGGPQGQSFKISAIFPNRAALASDLQATSYSPVKLNEFVIISYGMQNLDAKLNEVYQSQDNDYYKNNVATDLTRYGVNYNATLWQKVYSEDLEPDPQNKIFWYKNDKYSIAGLEDGVTTKVQGSETNNTNNLEYVVLEQENMQDAETSTLSYCYICICDLSGNTPELGVQKTRVLDPNEDPNVKLDITKIDYPQLIFSLPRAVKFHWLEIKDNDTDPDNVKRIDKTFFIMNSLGKGDCIIAINTGKLYTIDYIYLEDLNNDNIDYVRIEDFGGCEIDLVPNFIGNIDDTLETYSKENGEYKLTNPKIEVLPGKYTKGTETDEVFIQEDNGAFSSYDPYYSINIQMPKTYTPTDTHNIGYYETTNEDGSKSTIYMGDNNENDAFDFTTAIVPDNPSKYQFTATIPTPVSIVGIEQSHDYAKDELNNETLTLTNKYEIQLNNKEYNKTIPIKDGRGIKDIRQDKTLTKNLTDTYIITYNDKSTSEFYVENGNGIKDIEIVENDDKTEFALKVICTKKDENENQITETTNYVPKLAGPKGDSVEYIELILLEDNRTEAEKLTISDLVYVRTWLNNTSTVDKSKYDSTNKFLQVNLITYNVADTKKENQILLSSYQAWWNKNNGQWEVTGTISGGTGTAQLDWIDLD